MKRIAYLAFALILLFSAASITAFATTYTEFDIVFEEKDGGKVNDTAIRVFASVDDGKLVDRTESFTLESVEWFKYLPKPAEGKTAEDYDYVDEELKIYGMLCTDADVFEHEQYSYFLRIGRLYAKEEDTFNRNVRINGVDIEEMNGLCFNTGSEFYIKTVTNGHGGSGGENDITGESAAPDSAPDIEEPAKNKCRVCGICPIQPLGICLFIWIAVILIAAILVIVLIAKSKKDKKNEKKSAQ